MHAVSSARAPGRDAASDPANGGNGRPRHVAIVMDGNGRWASRRGMPRVAGHRHAVGIVRGLVEACVARRIPYLTLFAFSSENWRRPPSEVEFLAELLADTLENEIHGLREAGVDLRVIGDFDRFGSRVRHLIDGLEPLSSKDSKLTLTVAINYGGRWDVVQAAKAVAARVAEGSIGLKDVDERVFESFLATRDLPEPDLFIRAGGETRISNFLLWQMAYTELYFTDVLWPDFGEAELDEALDSYARRQRRFGGTGERLAAGS